MERDTMNSILLCRQVSHAVVSNDLHMIRLAQSHFSYPRMLPPDKNSITIVNPNKINAYTTGNTRDASRKVDRIKQESLPTNGEPCVIRHATAKGVVEGNVPSATPG